MLPLFVTISIQKSKSGKQNNCHIVSFFLSFWNIHSCVRLYCFGCAIVSLLSWNMMPFWLAHIIYGFWWSHWYLQTFLSANSSWLHPGLYPNILTYLHGDCCFLQLPSNTMTIQLSVGVGIVQSRHYHYIIISKIYCSCYVITIKLPTWIKWQQIHQYILYFL